MSPFESDQLDRRVRPLDFSFEILSRLSRSASHRGLSQRDNKFQRVPVRGWEKFRVHLRARRRTHLTWIHREDACLRARRAKRAGMADDPVWPDPFRPRIVALAEGKKKARGERRHDALAAHESRRYRADCSRETFNSVCLSSLRLPNVRSFVRLACVWVDDRIHRRDSAFGQKKQLDEFAVFRGLSAEIIKVLEDP